MKLKTAQIAPVRQQLLAKQGRLCAVCQMTIARDNDVLDHCHKHGALRGVLHRSCNSLLGVLENNRARYGLGDDAQFAAFLQGAGAYIERHKLPQTRYLHPTFLTEEEKRLKRNATARKKRATSSPKSTKATV